MHLQFVIGVPFRPDNSEGEQPRLLIRTGCESRKTDHWRLQDTRSERQYVLRKHSQNYGRRVPNRIIMKLCPLGHARCKIFPFDKGSFPHHVFFSGVRWSVRRYDEVRWSYRSRNLCEVRWSTIQKSYSFGGNHVKWNLLSKHPKHELICKLSHNAFLGQRRSKTITDRLRKNKTYVLPVEKKYWKRCKHVLPIEKKYWKKWKAHSKSSFLLSVSSNCYVLILFLSRSLWINFRFLNQNIIAQPRSRIHREIPDIFISILQML
jgi:hypothetical protein